MQLIERDDTGELRKFGVALAVLLPLVFALLLPWLFDRPRPVWPWIAGGVFLVWALVWARGLYPVYRGWMAIAAVLGRITNFIVLGGVFWLMIVPLGAVLRRLGKLQYREGFDADAATYRVTTRRRPTAAELENPF